MNSELKQQLIPLVQQLEEWRGSLVEIVEHISRRTGSFDRHCTTRSSFVMRLEFAGVAFSGAALTLLGGTGTLERDASYQAACDLVTELSILPGEVELVERLGPTTERHSSFKRLEEFPGNKPN